ncbi:peroxidasin homolog [Pecten maximus]|uniref:peroxidasin homolog n=1 Tax=Pecten maximus TaxID=6579 RepID=UPI0014588088|nr:peroxidasin homolog [Pecten maximus]
MMSFSCQCILAVLLASFIASVNANSVQEREELVERIIDILKSDEKRMNNPQNRPRVDILVADAEAKGLEALEDDYKLKYKHYINGIDKIANHSGSESAVAYTDYTPGHAEELDNRTTVAITALQYILDTLSIKLDDFQTDNDKYTADLRQEWEATFGMAVHQCTDEEKEAEYRSIDGSCNNLINAEWGMSVTPRIRFIQKPAYSDVHGLTSPRKAIDGSDLPSSRHISIVMSRYDEGPETPDDTLRTVALTGFGQFLDHELTDTALSTGFLGSVIECCTLSKEEREKRIQCIGIEIPDNDPAFQGRECLECVRTAGALADFRIPGPRQQINDITAYIDGSAVYGSEEERAEELWDHSTGKLKEQKPGFPPEDTDGDACVKNFADQLDYYCPKAGDRRSSDISHLTVIHVVFLRMHNDIILLLSDMNPKWDGEKLYQETRKIIGAIIQKITYSEWLPLFIGEAKMKDNDLRPDNGKQYKYDSKINPSINNELSIVLRTGHSIVTPKMKRMNISFVIVEERENQDIFLDPYLTFRSAGEVMRWMVSTPGKASDRFVNNPFLDSLFENLGLPLDLIAINIQREREFGLAPYADYHEKCGLGKIQSWDDLKNHDNETVEVLKQAYAGWTVKDIDLFIGGLSEKKLDGASLGPTFACIFVDQFSRLKFGDRFWFENRRNKPKGIGFTREQISAIQKVTFSGIICRYYHLDLIQEKAFEIPSTGDRKPCADLPFLDIREWKEE